MSYTIEYGRKIFYTETKPLFNGDEGRIYYLLIKEGDNNVWDADMRKRSRSWDLVLVGYKYQIIELICCRAGACEGGALQRPKGWRNTVGITPEDYLALYREEIRKAKPLEDIFKFFSVDAVIKALKDEYESKIDVKNEKYSKGKIVEAIQKYNDWRKIKDIYENDPEYDFYERSITTVDDMIYISGLPTWRHGSNYYYHTFNFHEFKKIKIF